jgi:lincosamide nucleotidyltransferase A/C/D/E
MAAEAATDLLDRLADCDVDACVGGGWAVDALLGEQTREHSDLDLWVAAADLEPLIVAFAGRGLDRLLPWPGDRPWNFVLHDGGRLRVDLHLYEPVSTGSWHYGSVVGGAIFPSSALQGEGFIRGRRVRCEAPDWAVRWHSGYQLRAVDHHDMPLLCAKFALELPDIYR